MINIYRNDPEAVEKFLSAERSVRGNVESLGGEHNRRCRRTRG